MKENVEKVLEEAGRPLIYLNSSKVSKEGTAQDVLKRDPVKEGFTNASIRKAIFLNVSVDDKRTRNKTTRILAKLKAFGLISKIPRSFRYKIF